MSEVAISVVVPAYNMAPWLPATIESILSQTDASIEVVVVDDGSSDSTAQIAMSFEPDIRLIRQDNRGLAAARNAGADASSGAAVFFLDADDVLRPHAIEQLLHALDAFPSAAVINPSFELEHADGTIVQPRNTIDTERYSRRSIFRLILSNTLGANTVMRKFIWEKHSYDETLRACEDLDLWFRLLLDNQIIIKTHPAAIRRRIGRSDALSNQTLMMRRCRRQVFERLSTHPELLASEWLALGYQLVRSSIGQLVAAGRGGRGTYEQTVAELGGSSNLIVRRTVHLFDNPLMRPIVRRTSGQ